MSKTIKVWQVFYQDKLRFESLSQDEANNYASFVYERSHEICEIGPADYKPQDHTKK